MSALLIFSLLHLVFLFIYLSGIYSLAPSHKPLSFVFALQSSHHKKKIYLDEQYVPLGEQYTWLECDYAAETTVGGEYILFN